LITLAVTVSLFPLTGNATDVSGDQWGTWTKENSPYNVIGEIRVPAMARLVIEAGVLVNFQGHYKFIVDTLATLLAEGNQGDSIYFTTEDSTAGWHGIRFLFGNNSSRLRYCRLEYGKATGSDTDASGGAIYFHNSSPLISCCTISRNSAEEYGGGIVCHNNSCPVISNNDISGNSAWIGGGIRCSDYSEPTISGNIITGNSADWGGGIHFESACSLTLTDNTIRDNSVARSGGGIHGGLHSSLIISNCSIVGNSANFHGGGVSCTEWCNTAISNSLIIANSAEMNGGGVHCARRENSLTINNCIVNCNSANGYGGGIACYDNSTLTISNSAISENSASGNGGGVCFLASSSMIVNTILWADTAPSGQEIWGSPTVVYCDVQGGWPGEGNIAVDPLFRDPENGDFHLMAVYCGDPYDSPCIDAGHPDSLDVLLDCFHGLGSDRCDMGAYGGRNSGWPTGIEDDDSNLATPGQFLLLQNYPNPFNAITVIEYQVPVNGYVKLEILNLLGQKVATLVDSKQQTGYRSVAWDASGLSSGLYLYKLTAGGFSETRKMALVK